MADSKRTTATYLALGLTVFLAVEAALVGAVEFYLWRARSAAETALNEAAQQRALERNRQYREE